MTDKNPDLIVSKELKMIFSRLLDDIKKASGQDMAVSLCVFNAKSGSRMNYISNCDRQDVVAAWSGLINAWEGGMPDVKAHEVS